MRIAKYQTILVKEQGFNYDTKITNSEEMATFLCDCFHADMMPTEHLWQICFNNKGKVIGVFEVGHGGIAHCNIEPAAVARNAILTNAASVIIAHNHPSGDTRPSNEDIVLTKRLHKALELLGIRLNDHIILGEGYTSLANQGIL